MVKENLIVDKNNRKQDVGKSLLTALEERGENNEHTQRLFITEENRREAISFYGSMGFNRKEFLEALLLGVR